jgi:hypothetical protein
VNKSRLAAIYRNLPTREARGNGKAGTLNEQERPGTPLHDPKTLACLAGSRGRVHIIQIVAFAS